MANINKIQSTNRAKVPGDGVLANAMVKAGDFNPLVDRVNSLTSSDGTLDQTLTAITVTTATITNANITTETVATINEKTAGSGIAIGSAITQRNTLTALNSTGTITAAMLATGGITSTSAAGVTATLDTIANISTQFGTPTAGFVIPFYVQNPGASTVTVAVSSGIVAAKQVSNGDTAVDVSLSVAASATVGSAKFEIVFISATAAVLHRVY